jgi:polyribonucleotide nucleotidyltransferase
MDAGVPIKAPVAGIAMGLVTPPEGGLDRYAILTDIQGVEDALGDMDFKVAGTAKGITALQMDIKIHGLTRQIMQEALAQAREARLFILEKMAAVLKESRPQLSPYAPRLHRMKINPDRIRDVIGPGGKTIRRITEETKTTIDIEDDGTVIIGSTDAAGLQRAIEIINGLTRDVEVGGVYTGRVTRIMAFGAFVEILPGKEGLIHISELADHRVGKVEDVVNIGDEVKVLVTEIDRQGRINLSRRALLEAATPAEDELEEFGEDGEEFETEEFEEEPQPTTPVVSRPPRRGGGQAGGRPPRREGFGGNGGGFSRGGEGGFSNRGGRREGGFSRGGGDGGFGRGGQGGPRREGPGGRGGGQGGPRREGPGGPGGGGPSGQGGGRGPRGPRREGPGGGGPRRPPREPFSPRW